MVQFAAPVAMAAIGEVVVQQSGVIDIGLEGTMLTSAFFGMLTCYQTHNPWLGVCGGIVAALAVSLLIAIFTVVLACDQVVVGTAVNLLALGLTGSLYRSEFGQSGALISVAHLPQWYGVDPLEGVMLFGVGLSWYLLRKCAWGLAVRAAGEFPPAVQASGLSVRKLRVQALLFGGFFAGLGGVYLSLVVSHGFTENMTAGRGFVAIAMVTFGRWKPSLVFVASLAIGFAGSLQFWLQNQGWKIPYQFFLSLPYLLALTVLVFVGKGAKAPSALAVPFEPH